MATKAATASRARANRTEGAEVEGFAAWSLDDAREAINDLSDEIVDTNALFVAGDHWQEGDGWVGPHPQPGEDGYSEVMAEIEAAFTSRNVIGEVVGRHESFVIGTSPRWGLTPRRALKEGEEPTGEEQALIDEAEAALTDWWDRRKVHSLMQALARQVVWAERSAMRLYVPKGKLQSAIRGDRKVNIVAASTVEEGLAVLWPDTPSYDQATVVEDEDTKEQCGVFLYDSDDEDGEAERAELSYLDGDLTVIRQVGRQAARQLRLNLGRRLPMFEITRPLLITEQIQRSQRALNLAASMLPRNVVTGGFLERVLLNAQMPGQWETNEKGEPTRFIPASFQTGAGTTNFVTGVQYKDEQGVTRLSTPDIRWREPISVDSPIAAKQEHYKDILEEAKQGHIIAGTDSKLGWKSREQLRADSDKELDRTRTQLEAAGRWLLETALAMAEAFMGQPGKYTNVLRAEFVCLASSGPLSIDERKDNRDAAATGHLSRATAMERNGVEDVDAELARIASEPDARADEASQQATAIQSLTAAGASIQGAAQFIGIDEERAKLLVASDTDDEDLEQ